MQIAADIAIPLADADIDIEVLDAAWSHIRKCRQGFERRNAMHGAEVPSSSKGLCINETFGYDHKALEGFGSYEESLRQVLIDEMTSSQEEDRPHW